MMLSPKTLLPLVSALVLSSASCLLAEGLQVAKLDRKTPINFNKEIYPFFKRNCLACHNYSKAKAKLVLETADAIRKGSSDGPVVVPGKAEESLLFLTSAHLVEDGIMPPKNNKSKAKDLTPQELALLKLWIDQGAKGSGAVIAEAPKQWLQLQTGQPVYALAISPNGRYAASGRGHDIDVYDIKLKKHLARLADPVLKDRSHLDLVRSLAFDKDGTLASGGYRMIKLWEASPMSPQKFQRAPQPKGAAAVSHDRSWRLYLDESLTTIKKWSQNGKLVQSLSFPEKILAVAILHDQKQIALGLDSGTIRVVKLEAFTQKPAPQVKKPATTPAAKPPPAKQAAPNAAVVKSAPSKPAAKPAPAKPAPPKPAPAQAAPPKPKPLDPALYVDLKGHGKRIFYLHSDATYPLLGADADGKVIIWDLKQKKPKATFDHGGGLKHVAMHPVSKRMVTASEKGKVLLWDLNNPAKYLANISQDPTVKAEIDGLSLDITVAKANVNRATAKIKTLEETVKKELESSTNMAKELTDKEKELQEAEKKQPELANKKKASQDALAKAKDDASKKKLEEQAKKDGEEFDKAAEELQKIKNKIASLKKNKERAVVMHKKSIQDVETAKADKAKEEARQKSLEEKSKKLNEHQSKAVPQLVISGGAFTEDGSSFAVAYANGNVHLYASEQGIFLESISTGKPIQSLHPHKGERIVTVDDKGQAMSWPTQRKWALSKKIGDGKNGEVLIDRVDALGFGPDSTLVSASGIPSRKGQLKLWDLKTLKLKAKDLEAHSDLITSIQFSPDRKQFVTGSSDGLAKIYDLATLKKMNSLEGHGLAVLDVSWSGDGRLIATSSADGKVILWDTKTGEKYKTISGKGGEVTIVKFMSKTSEALVMAEGDGMIKANNRDLPGKFTYAYTASLTPDGSMILAGGQSGELRLWDAVKYSLLKSFEPLP